MNSGNPILKTLKRLGYHEADSLDDSDFDSIVSEKELKSFFEVFCMLNEKNVLTVEDIEEYTALTPAELAEIELLKKNGILEKNAIEYEKKKEVLFLQEQLTHIENHNKSIERQVEIFKKCEENLLEEKEIQHNFLLDAKKRFQSYEMCKVPQAEEELVSILKSILKVAQDLEFLIVHSDASDNKLVPTSNIFKEKVQQYLDAEEKILQCVNTYLQNNFQLHEDGTLSFIVDENLYRNDLIKEASFLQKTLKSSMSDNLISENEAQKNEGIVKYLETAKTSDLNCHSSQLRYKTEDALKLNEQLKEKEGELKAFTDNAISKYVDAFLTEVDLCVANETFTNFQFCIEKMSLPMNTLLSQRTRVEILRALLSEHKGELENVKELIEKVINQVEQEKSYLQERKILNKNEMADDAQKNEQHLETEILSSLCNILTISENFTSSDKPKVSINDAVGKATKFFEVKENLDKKHDEKIKIIESVQKYAYSVESLLNCSDKEYSDWHELEQTMNTNLNILHMKLASLEGSITECNQDLEQKQKLLERKGNLRLARNLYIYALTNKELFKKCIDDIKVAVENSAD